MMQPFDYTALPARVLFGDGRLQEIAGEVRRLGCERALVLSTPGQRRAAKSVAEYLSEFAAGIFDGAVDRKSVV